MSKDCCHLNEQAGVMLLALGNYSVTQLRQLPLQFASAFTDYPEHHSLSMVVVTPAPTPQ
jgi:hypothetical protein